MHTALRGAARSNRGVNRAQGALCIHPHAQAAQCRCTSHGRGASATWTLLVCPVHRATKVFEAADRSRLRRRERRNCAGAALGACWHVQAVWSHSPCHARGGSATLGPMASLHGQSTKGLGCCMQHCEGWRAATRGSTARRVHRASIHMAKQRNAVAQAMGAVPAQPGP